MTRGFARSLFLAGVGGAQCLRFGVAPPKAAAAPGDAGVRYEIKLSDLSVAPRRREGEMVGASTSDVHLAQHDGASRAGTGKNRVRWRTDFMNASLAGSEVACLGCDPQMFAAWLTQLGEPAGTANDTLRPAHATLAPVVESDTAGKHPASPGYEDWARQERAAERRAVGLVRGVGRRSRTSSNHTQDPTSPLDPGYWETDLEKKLAMLKGPEGIEIFELQYHELEDMKPRLQHLWTTRRLVVGQADNPTQESLDFVEALVSLARASPSLTASECARATTATGAKCPYCDVLFGEANATSDTRLRAALDHTFGIEFLQMHKHEASRRADEHRRSVKALLMALKSNYSFYHQKCLSHERGAETCDRNAPSRVLGQMACKAEDNEPWDDCVYADVRHCERCGAHTAGRFFEYSRFHGPLTLFETRSSRQRVMGQCEEFARAAHALLGSLGYEVRYVLDFTDHVWIEVRLPTGKGDAAAWFHADPSEGVLDQPLMYEKGWGKKLTMIFAFTPSHIEHVTERYTANYRSTIWRRGISERDLADALQEANQRLSPKFQGRESDLTRSAHSQFGTIALWRHFEGASIASAI